MPSLFISKGACSHSCGWVFTFRLSRKGERQGESGGGGKRRKQDGREGGHPSEMECKFSRVDRWREGSSPASTRVFVDLQSKQPNEHGCLFSYV